MAAHKQARQHAMDNFVVPDDYPADLLLNRLIALGELGRPLFHGCRNTHQVSPYSS
jgi:hypothetical protein